MGGFWVASPIKLYMYGGWGLRRRRLIITCRIMHDAFGFGMFWIIGIGHIMRWDRDRLLWC